MGEPRWSRIGAVWVYDREGDDVEGGFQRLAVVRPMSGWWRAYACRADGTLAYVGMWVAAHDARGAATDEARRVWGLE